MLLYYMCIHPALALESQVHCQSEPAHRKEFPQYIDIDIVR